MDTFWGIGIDLGGTKIEAALVDSSGNVKHPIKILTKVAEGPAGVIQQIIEICQDLQKKSNTPIQGIGIGLAGQIDQKTQLIHFAPNLKWREVDLRAQLFPHVKVPIYIDNDVRCATRGEKLFGAGQGCSNFICLFLGTGIGGGIVIDDKIYAGSSHTAGEFGHMTIQLNGPLCTCGNYGCLEAISSGWALARQASAATGQSDLSARFLFAAAEKQDIVATKIIDRAVEALTAGLISIVNAWNPQKIILGGGLLKGYEKFLNEIEQTVRARALPSACTHLQIEISRCQDKAVLLGAAFLPSESKSDKKCCL